MCFTSCPKIETGPLAGVCLYDAGKRSIIQVHSPFHSTPVTANIFVVLVLDNLSASAKAVKRHALVD